MTNQQLQENLIHEALNGPTPIEQSPGAVLNPSEALPTGLGPGADQPFFSGASQNVRTTWVEQGWGHDSMRWPYYPYSVGDNPARQHSRIKSLGDDQRENLAPTAWLVSTGTEAPRQTLWGRLRRSGANVHGAVVDIPDAVPYTDTVPTYSGGPLGHPGVDVPLGALYGP